MRLVSADSIWIKLLLLMSVCILSSCKLSTPRVGTVVPEPAETPTPESVSTTMRTPSAAETVSVTEVPQNIVGPFRVEMIGRTSTHIYVYVENTSHERVILRRQNGWPVQGSVGGVVYDYFAPPDWRYASKDETYLFPGFRRVIRASIEAIPVAATALSLQVKGIRESNKTAGVWLSVPEDEITLETLESLLPLPTGQVDEPILGQQSELPTFFSVTPELIDSGKSEQFCIKAELTNLYGKDTAYSFYMVDTLRTCQLKWSDELNDPITKPSEMYIVPLATATQYYCGVCPNTPHNSRLVITMSYIKEPAFVSYRID